ncbi:MAG: hypothetical protein ACM36C_16450, partial [Acidobacteriota bacterium]
EIVVPTEELVRRTSQRRVCSRCGFTTIADGSANCSRCGGELISRSDDGEAVVRERLQVYLRQTQPLVDYYKARPTFRVVNGNQPQGAVAADLRAAIEAACASGRQAARRTPGRTAERL